MLERINLEIKPTDRVLLKPNFNTADPFPASTDMGFLSAVIEVIKQYNPKEIIVGESCTYFLKTEKVCAEKGISDLVKKYGITYVNFDQDKWVTKKVEGGKYFKSVKVTEWLDKVDKIILLPCLKTHFLAAYTGALKIAVGFQKPNQRMILHANHLQERVAELASVFKPDLVIMDGRKCFVTKGPSEGRIENPNILMASTDRIAIDIEGIKIINSYDADNMLPDNPWDLAQIKRAVELNIGVKSESEYEVIEL